jgi:DNA-binding NtrC family response regulator
MLGDPPERILVVDDDLEALASLRDILGKEDYRVEVALGREEALQRLDAEWFDLVISALRLPGMDGLNLALIESIQLLAPGLPCIAVAEHATAEAVGLAMKAGAHDCLSKPVHPEDLMLAVRSALEFSRWTERWNVQRPAVLGSARRDRRTADPPAPGRETFSRG